MHDVLAQRLMKWQIGSHDSYKKEQLWSDAAVVASVLPSLWCLSTIVCHLEMAVRERH